MLQIHTDNITLGASAADKSTAIKLIAEKLVESGFVQEGYVDGMLAREEQSSTFLGNGIAIPHGTTDTRELVKQTGLQLFQFPQGVDWGDGSTVYLAIGIAAKSDEHLTILRQLTRVLDQDHLDEQLKSMNEPQQIVDLLAGVSDFQFSEESILIDFPVTNLAQLKAVAAGQLKQMGVLSDQAVGAMVNNTPVFLGEGVWLLDNSDHVEKSGLCVVRAKETFNEAGDPVHTLLAFAAKDEKAKPALEIIAALLSDGQLGTLNQADAKSILNTLSGQAPQSATSSVDETELPEGTVQGTIALKNPHGLHARPGAVLVKAIKTYDVKVQVENLTEGTGPVNGRSLMKVIGLGARHQHELRFTISGDDAQAALEHIQKEIEAGLGEEV